MNPFQENLAYYDASDGKPFLKMTLVELFESTCQSSSSEKEAYAIYDENFHRFSMTYKQWNERSTKLANCLVNDICKGDKVGILSPNCLDAFVALMAVMKLGANVFLLRRGDFDDNVMHKFNLKTLVLHFDFLDEFKNIEEDLADYNILILTTSNSTTTNLKKFGRMQFFYDKLLAKDEKEIEKCDPIVLQSDSNALVFLTSGSTGKPKAVQLSHDALLNAMSCYIEEINSDKTSSSYFNDRPFVYIVGILTSFITTLFGIKSITTMLPSYSIDLVVKILKAEDCSHAVLFGYRIFDLIEISKEQKITLPLKYAMIGGQVISKTVLSKFHDYYPEIKIINMFGCTELVVLSTMNLTDSINNNVVGKPIRFFKVSVRDENNQIVKYNQPGELCVSSKCLFKYYVGDEKATEKAWTKDGWFRMGDQCMLNENGYITYLGRIKDMIKIAGVIVYPLQIENHIHNLLDNYIQTVCIISLPDERLGECMCACFIMKRGINNEKSENWNSEEIKNVCLANSKVDSLGHKWLTCPKHVVILDNFPKTFSGKTDKIQLRNIAADILNINID